MSLATYFDIILSIPLLWGIYRGFCKGFIIELASLIALILGVYGAIKFSDFFSDFVREKFASDTPYLSVISFASTFILIVIGIHLLARVIETFVNIASLKLVNKIAGALFGLLKTGIIILMLLFIVRSADSRLNWMPEEIKAGSHFYRVSAKIPLNEFRVEDLKSVDILTKNQAF